MLSRSTIQLLRFHFSLFLLPVFLFALSQANDIHPVRALCVFVILHIFVYPSSNGYNSYMDRDQTPIGGLRNPMQPTRQLFRVSVVMDILAIGAACFISWHFAAGVLIYILASRAYSYRGIRLKKYPVAGYAIVVFFQGAWIFYFSFHAVSQVQTVPVPWAPVVAAACLIGGYYPLTQVYQHKEDIADGVRTISYLLGKKGTFVFCGIVFALATAAMFFTFNQQNNLRFFWLFAICMLPMVLFFSWWTIQVWHDGNKASFKNSLIMNLLASICTTICFSIIIIQKNFE